MLCVQIYKDGKMEEIKIIKNKKFSCNTLCKIFNNFSKSQGNDSIKELYSWSHDNYNIRCFSWYDGESGFENKHELPPSGISDFLEEDSSNKLLFGDIFLVKEKDNKIFDFSVSDYGVFYNIIFDGFYDCEESSDIESNSFSEEDPDYDPNDYYTDEDYEIITDEENNELDIDNNNY